MNFAFWLLVLVGVIIVWFALANFFPILGKLCYRIYDNAMKKINQEETSNKGSSEEDKKDESTEK